MNTKLTLRVDDSLIETAKAEANRRGKSVSQMVSEFFDSLARAGRSSAKAPPVTASLVGVLKGRKVSEGSYKAHLREKYL